MNQKTSPRSMFLVLGLASDRPVTIDDTSLVAARFSQFFGLMQGLGAMLKIERNG